MSSSLFFGLGANGTGRDLGLLILRLGIAGTMAMAHGWGTFSNFAQAAPGFPDPLGLGSTTTAALVVFAELFCAAAVAVGLFTRFATVPLMINMGVAFFVVHAADPFERKELAFLFLVAYLAIFLAGPGRFSLDGLFAGRRRGARAR